MSEWISVNDRLPEDRVDVLVLVFSPFVERFMLVAWHNSEIPYWCTTASEIFRGADYKRVTHWMPLPELPEDAETVSTPEKLSVWKDTAWDKLYQYDGKKGEMDALKKRVQKLEALFGKWKINYL